MALTLAQGLIFALFSRIGTTEPPTAKQRIINSDIGVVRDAPGFQVNKKGRSLNHDRSDDS